MNETEKIGHFFSDIKPVIAIAKQAQAQLDRYAATAFSVFDCLGVKEIRLSRMLANLLNPKGTHGQGDRFLRLFLDEMKLNTQYAESDLGACEVELEHQTDRGRRIDIVLKFENPTRWLGIENKPTAAEGDEQCKDYLQYLCLKRTDPKEHIWLCYMSGDGHSPQSITDCKYCADRCLTVSYRTTEGKPSVEHWIEQSWKECDAERVRWALRDLLNYIQWNFGSEDVPVVARKEDVVEETTVDFIEGRIKNRAEDLRVAIQIQEAMPRVRKNLLDEFFARFECHLRMQVKENKEKEGKDWRVSSWKWSNDFGCVLLHKEKWHAPKKDNWDNSSRGVALSADKNEIWFGVAASNLPDGSTNKITPITQKTAEKVGKALKGHGITCDKYSKISPKWIGLYVNSMGDRGVWDNPVFLETLADTKKAGELIEELIKNFFRMADAVEKIFDDEIAH